MKQILLHILLMTTTATLDAHSTNRYYDRWWELGYRAHEHNPIMRPFAGKPAMYVALPAFNLGVYFALRKTKHPKLAAAYAYGVSAVHLGCVVVNRTREPKPWLLPPKR